MAPEQWMKAAGINHTDLAKQWGISLSTVWRYTNGQRPPPLEIVVAFDELSRGKVRDRDWAKIYPSRLTRVGKPQED